MTFRDASNGWVTGETPQPDLIWLYHTTDGGETWAPTSPVKTKLAANGVLLADFADPAHGWTSDGTLLFSTADGGRSWATKTPGKSLAGVQQFDFVSPQVGWGVMPEGPATLLKTMDGGATWTVAGSR